MSRQSVGWYVRRLRRMSPTELVWRTRDHARRTTWAYQQVRPGEDVNGHPPGRYERPFASTLPPATVTAVPEEACKAVLATADAIMAA